MTAREHLERQGFEVVAPRYMKRRRHARRVEDVPVPLFPRYIFACFDVEDSAWRVIRSTRGVADLVSSGLGPLSVPFEIIEEIRSRVDEWGYSVLAQNRSLVPGERLQIEAGPFAEYEAIFTQMRDEDRVIVLLSLLGRSVRAEVPLQSVRPLG